MVLALWCVGFMTSQGPNVARGSANGQFSSCKREHSYAQVRGLQLEDAAS